MKQILFGAMLAAFAGQAFAHTNYTGYSSAPGRQTCASSCHGSGGGTVTVSGFPELYTPGTPYTITLGHNGGSSIRNFNGSCRLGTGTANAGVISAGMMTSTYNTSGETNGVRLSSSNQNSATFIWTAPAAGSGSARLYIAALQGGYSGQNTRIVLVAEEQTTPAEPVLELASLAILSDDDSDGQAESGETVGFQLALHNTGTATATSVSGTLSLDSPWAQLTQPASDWPNIPTGSGRVNGTPFELVVNPNLTQNETITLGLHVTATDYTVDLEAQLQLVYAPPPPPELTAGAPQLLSDSDNDGALEPGETATLLVALVNNGSQALTGVHATLTATNGWMELPVAASDWPDLPSGGAAQNLTPFTLQLLEVAPPLYEEAFALHVVCDQGEATPVFTLPIGHRETVWSTDLEDGGAGWSHEAAAGWLDDWHLDEAGSGSPLHAWKCGAVGEGNYQNHLDARLVTPPVTLLPSSRLSFFHSLNAEVSSAYPDSAYDGGVVEISSDGGANWERLTPSGGYPCAFRFLTGAGAPATHPFPGGTPCYSGELAWQEAVFDLAEHAGAEVLLRFRFGSDDGTRRAGWVIDDPIIVGLHQDTALTPPLRPGRLELLPAAPNPFNPSTTIGWTMPEAGPARAQLFSLDGRLVRTLWEGSCPAGVRTLRLDGVGLASGAYLLRVSAAGESRVQKLLLLK